MTQKEALKKGEAGEWVKSYKGTMNNQSRSYRWEIYEKRESTDWQPIKKKKKDQGMKKAHEAKKLKYTKYKLKLRFRLVHLEDKMKY